MGFLDTLATLGKSVVGMPPNTESDGGDDDSLKRVLSGLPAQYRRNPNAALDTGDGGLPEQYSNPAADLPSFGQRLGRKSPVAPTPEAAQAKTRETQTASAPKIAFDPAKVPSGILPSTAKVDAPMPSYGAPAP